MQETLLVQSLKMVKGKSVQYEWFGTGDDKGLGGLDIWMTEKWIDEITGIYGLSDRIIFKVLVPATIVSIVLAYTLLFG